MNVGAFLANRDAVFPPFRQRALWVFTQPLRDLWTRRYFSTPDGQDLIEACMWRVIADEELQKRGLRIRRGQDG